MSYLHIEQEHLRLLLDQSYKYKTGITAIQEIRWIGQGTLREKGSHYILQL